MNKVFNQILKDTNFGEFMPLQKESNYKWLSIHAHGHFMSLMISSVVLKTDMTTESNSYCLPDTKVMFTINKLILTLGFNIETIYKLLINHHNLEKYVNTELFDSFEINQYLYSSIFFKNIEYLLENEKRL